MRDRTPVSREVLDSQARERSHSARIRRRDGLGDPPHRPRRVGQTTPRPTSRNRARRPCRVGHIKADGEWTDTDTEGPSIQDIERQRRAESLSRRTKEDEEDVTRKDDRKLERNPVMGHPDWTSTPEGRVRLKRMYKEFVYTRDEIGCDTAEKFLE